MTTAEPASTPIYCDGCTQEATADHLERRINRLEWASRFRPFRIGTLFLSPAPPARIEDFFYFPRAEPRDPQALALYEDLLDSCGIDRQSAGSRQAALRQFEQAGYFSAECVECPMGFLGGAEFDALIARLMPTLERRIRFSYRPRAIMLISDRLSAVAHQLSRASLEIPLLMHDKRPVSLPNAADASGRERFRSQVASLLAQQKPQ